MTEWAEEGMTPTEVTCLRGCGRVGLAKDCVEEDAAVIGGSRDNGLDELRAGLLLPEAPNTVFCGRDNGEGPLAGD